MEEYENSGVIKIEENFRGYPLNSFQINKGCVEYVDNVLLPLGLALERIKGMALQIQEKFEGKHLVLICVLKGGAQFLVHLLEELSVIRTIQGDTAPIEIEFIRMYSYKNEETTGKVTYFGEELLSCIEGKHAIIVDSLIETGLTVVTLMDIVKKFNPSDIKVATLTLKKYKGVIRFIPDFCGFEIPEKFVVGHLTDYNQFFRDSSHLYSINKKCKDEYKV